MKNVYLKLAFVLYSVICLSTYLKASEHRALIVLQECGNNEGFAKTLNATNLTDTASITGALTVTFLEAVYQKAAPILVSGALIESIIEYKIMYDDFIQLNLEDLKQKYGSYKLFSEPSSIQELRTGCLFLEAIYTQSSKIHQSAAPKNAIGTIWKELGGTATSLPFITQLLFSSSKIPFDDYIIKKIVSAQDYHFYLLIPKSYLPAKIQNDATFGLKTQALQTVTLQDINPTSKNYAACHKDMSDVITSLFVTKKDLQNYPFIWSIFMSGHGIYSETIQGYIRGAQQTLENSERQLVEAKNNPFYRQDLKAIEERISRQKIDLITLENKQHIAGIGMHEFRKLLVFFNSQISVNFLFYNSCFAAGQQAIDAYYDFTNKKQLMLNYPIASDAITEATTFTRQFTLHINFIPSIYELTIPIDKNGFIKMLYKSNFKAFFDALKSSAIISYNKLLSYVSFYASPDKILIANRPKIRFPGTQWFSIVDVDKDTYALTNTRAVAQGLKPLVIRNKNVLLISALTIPFPIIFNRLAKQSFPTFVSLQPGKAKHIFSSIEAPQYTLDEVLNGFFFSNKLYASKLFIIDKLLVKDATSGTAYPKEKLYTNVWIYNYVDGSRPTQGVTLQDEGTRLTSNWQLTETMLQNIKAEFQPTQARFLQTLAERFADANTTKTEVFSGFQEQSDISRFDFPQALRRKLIRLEQDKNNILDLSNNLQILASLRSSLRR